MLYIRKFPLGIGEPQPRLGATLDSVQRPLGHTRAESEAGTRRRPVRWSSTHGYQQDQPSCLTGSASSDARRKKYHEDLKKLLLTLDIGSHINAGRQLLPEAE